ncbi:Na+/H+ antiporter NhaC [Rikenella microfusus]|uniref:Na+/H+ antiporter NhaC n=1 Tax=Rikenella microfusus TaxID=28139 RepID=UPI001D65D912|nr:Na+/H+ antiporter NhaC [Rikenella microfusus]HJE87561.1 Na+/H+ antiporter NhaC [Rikenella microfusus]
MTQRQPTIFQSVIPILVLLGLIMTTVLGTGADALAGANQLSLLVASAVGAGIAVYNRVRWADIMQGMVHTISASLPAILILLLVGMLSGSWMTSGVIPTMIYYGLDILRPDYFLPACVVISAAVSVATGSSWSTIATIGVALIGIGHALGFDMAMTAGAIISGAYFGDKVSPLSDTTNLASAVTGTDLFVHIRYMMQTTVPSILLTLAAFAVLTLAAGGGDAEASGVDAFQNTIASTYRISPLLLLIPVLVVFMIVRKIPAVPVLMIGSLIAVGAAALFQQELLATLTPDGRLTLGSGYEVLTRSLYGETVPHTGDATVDDLLATGGMAGMLNTVWLIITAMVFGGVMEAGRFLERITGAILSRVRSAGGLVTTATGSCLLFNLTSGDQYMSIVVPGKMFIGAFRRNGLQSRLLSRTLEDGGTATSVLVPWNTCGATQASILGVPTLVYLPFAFFCWLSPIVTLAVAWAGWGIRKQASSEDQPDLVPDRAETAGKVQ